MIYILKILLSILAAISSAIVYFTISEYIKFTKDSDTENMSIINRFSMFLIAFGISITFIFILVFSFIIIFKTVIIG